MNCPGCNKPLHIIPRQRAILECLDCHLVVIYTQPIAGPSKLKRTLPVERCDPATCVNITQCEHGCVGFKRREAP